MFDELKTYGIISVLLILVLGYFVYIIYRDNIVLKNNIKELKEALLTEADDVEDDIFSEEEYEHQHEHEDIQGTDVVYTDLDEYFSHVTPNNLHTIEEVEPEQEEPEPKIEEIQKKPKGKRAKKVEVVEVELN